MLSLLKPYFPQIQLRLWAGLSDKPSELPSLAYCMKDEAMDSSRYCRAEVVLFRSTAIYSTIHIRTPHLLVLLGRQLRL